VRLHPSADDFNNLACVYKDLGCLPDAIANYRHALQLCQDNPNVFCNLVHSLQMVCDWSDYEARMVLISRIVEQQILAGQFPSIHPHHTFLYRLSNSTRRAIAAAHATAAERNIVAMQRVYNHRGRPRSGRLRVGYVSSDFKESALIALLTLKDHPTSHLMQSVPGMHDRSVVEVRLLSNVAYDSVLTEGLLLFSGAG
jgi:protein O-GlcNAc transferase